MRPAAQWVLLSLVLSLAFGATLRGDDENTKGGLNFSNQAECCNISKALPLMKNVEPDTSSCAEFLKDASVEDGQLEDCAIECTLSENGVLNKDKTINQQNLRALVIGCAYPDAHAVLQASLDECLRDDYLSAKIDSCVSEADQLFLCIATGVVMNCPDAMLLKNDPQCRADKGAEVSASGKK